jgi:hypothetical protein
LAVTLYSPPAYAYVDPGTGSALVYVVTAIVVSIYFAARGLYYKALSLAFGFRSKNRKHHLAIHSEDPRYEIVFLPVIRALAERNVDFTYFTMYERDDSFEPLPARTAHQAIPPGLVGYSFLNRLEAKMLVTTTPQVDVMTFRRSEKVRHYCYLPHALSEARHSRPFFYDFFDSVLCCGPVLKENIRKIESVRKFPAKNLLDTGIPHYDELVKQAVRGSGEDARSTVLIAPSWGPTSLFAVFGTGFVRSIAKRFRVIVRPHPQMKVSQPRLYEEILAMVGVTIDTQKSPASAMSAAGVLVSDFSGIVYEFAFIHEKPVIIVDHEISVEGLEGHLLGNTASLKELCSDFVVAVPPSLMENLADTIERILHQGLKKRIAEKRDEIVYNFGHAGAVAARQIEETVRCL